MDVRDHGGRRATSGRAPLATRSRALALALAVASAAAGCSGTSAPVGSTNNASPAPAPLDMPLVNATTRRPLEGDPAAALDRLSAGTSAGTLLARSTDDRVCIFANGRNGWNRAAC